MAIAAATTTVMTNAAATASTTEPSAIEAAARANLFWFVLSTLAAVAVVVFGVMSFRSSNKVQDAIKADADARIEEARNGAADANQKAGEANKLAGAANERAEKLAEDNLKLRGKIAGLEKEAANQRERAAVAERQLLHLRVSLAARYLSDEQTQTLITALSNGTKGPILLQLTAGDPEIQLFGGQLSHALTAAGWTVTERMLVSSPVYAGLVIRIRDMERAPKRANALLRALAAVGLSCAAEAVPTMPENDVELIVGRKFVPNP